MNKIIKYIFLYQFFITFSISGYSQESDKNFSQIKDLFNEIKVICEKDNGVLWGVNLWCPILLFDPETRKVIANEQDNLSSFSKREGLYHSIFPDSLMHGNTTLFFNGKQWAMICYPLPKTKVNKSILFIHEMFHTAQKELGLDVSYDNKHIDNFEARVWLKLEWNALEKAVQFDSLYTESIRDALIFREYRRSLFYGADSSENKFEIHEGLADYTAYTLCYTTKYLRKEAIKYRKKVIWNVSHYKRAFGYLSGLMYGYLLDGTESNWRKEINNKSDLGEILQKSLTMKIPYNIEDVIIERATQYGYDSIYQYEIRKKQTNDSIRNTIIQTFTNQPVINFSLKGANFLISSLPMQIDSMGTLYPTIEIISKWGKVVVEKGGCLFNESNYNASIPFLDYNKNNGTLISEKWKIKLKPDWQIVKDGSNYSIKFVTQ